MLGKVQFNRASGKVLELTKKFSLKSSLHGFVYLFVNRSYRAKQYWLLAIIFSITICVYNLILTGHEHFISRPTVTDLNYRSRKSAELPTVRICPSVLSHKTVTNDIMKRNKSLSLHSLIGYLHYNAVFADVRKLIAENLTTTFTKYPRLELMFNSMKSSFEKDFGVADNTYKNSSFEEVLRSHVGKPTKSVELNTDLAELFAAALHSLVSQCHWKGKICIEEWLPIANCLVFNPNDTVVYGPAESLRVILTINASDGAPYSSNAVGFTVGITNKFHYLDDRANAEVMPGYSYDLGIKKLIIDDKSGTTDCIPTGKLGHYKYLPQLGGYQYLWCVIECGHLAADIACNCTRGDSIFFNPDGGLACSELDSLLCSHATHKADESCYQKCRPQCSYEYNEVSIKMAKFPSRSAYRSGSLQVNRSKYSYEYLRQNGVELNIHFSTLTHTTIVTTLKYSFIDTISAFGGLGALMVGASLVTTVELIFFTLDMINLSMIEVFSLVNKVRPELLNKSLR